MRRRVRTIFVLLVLGTVTNILTCWSLAAGYDSLAFNAMLTGQMRRECWSDANDADSPIWVQSAYSRTGADVAVIHETHTTMMVDQRSRAQQVTREIHQHRTGWPMRALIGNDRNAANELVGIVALTPKRRSFNLHRPLSLIWETQPTTTTPKAVFVRGTIDKRLPLAVIPGGFAVNTAVFAAIFWLVLAIPATIRSIGWMWRGRCSHCGYPVGVSPVCTECGQRISRLVRRTKSQALSPSSV